MSRAQCRCGEPITDDAYLCKSCTRLLRTRLEEVDALADDLETTRTRQSQIGGGGSPSSERGLAWDERASEASKTLTAVLANLVHHVERTAAKQCRGPAFPVMSAYLRRHREHLRHHERAASLLDQLDAACTRGWKVVDRPPPKDYLGRCGMWTVYGAENDLTVGPCPTELYATKTQSMVACPWCEHEHDVEVLRTRILGQLEDHLLTAHELTTFSTIDRPITTGTIRRWVARGRLIPRTKRDDVDLFLVSDVRAALLADHESQSTRRDAATQPCTAVLDNADGSKAVCGQPVGMTKSGKPRKGVCERCRRKQDEKREDAVA